MSQMFYKVSAYFYQVVYIYQFNQSIQIQVTSLFLTILYFIITSDSHNLPTFKSYHMSTFFGQAIQQNQQLRIDFNHIKQKQQEYYLQLTHAALDVNSNVSHLYLKLQNKELLLLELNRSHPPLFATINIHIYPSDTPTLVSKSGKIHVSGYFCKKQEQKVKTLQKQTVQVSDLRQQKSKKAADSIQQLTKSRKKPEQQTKVYSSLRSSHPRKAKQTSVQKNVIEDKKTPDSKNSRQFFMTKTVVQKQKQTNNNKFDKNYNNKDKKQLLDNKKQVKRSSLSMLIKQAEQQDDSEDEDSDESFDESQQSDDDDEFQDDDQDQTPPAKNLIKSEKARQKQKQSEQTEQKRKSTAIEISQDPQDQDQKRDENQKVLKVWPGMGRIRLTRQQLDKVDFSQWTNLIKAPTKKPSFL